MQSQRVFRAASSVARRSLLLSTSRAYSSVSAAAQPVKKSKWRYVTRGALGLSAGAVGVVGYAAYQQRHPPAQAEFDPSKKTLVILGTGWGSTSILRELDTDKFNVVVVSPRNYFLFTPLLPSCTVGTIENRSIMEPIRYITRHKKREVQLFEGDCTDIDPINKTITVSDNSEIKGAVSNTTLKYDYLVVGVGAENQTFGVPGVREYGCFLKEIWDAKKIRTRLMDCIETAAFGQQPEDEKNRLLHMVVVGGGPTGVEYAAELHDFLTDDLAVWYPDIAGRVKITLIEAMPNVLPSFSKQLIEYTESTFSENEIKVLTKTAVKEVNEKNIVVEKADKTRESIPYGLLVWATGNTARPIVKGLMEKLPEAQTGRRGLLVDDHLMLLGAKDVFALGDCTFTKYPPLAQVANQQGTYLGKLLNEIAAKQDATQEDVEEIKKELKTFTYTHSGSLAYIGAEKAIADFPVMHGNISSGGLATFMVWRSAYLSKLFSVRQRTLVFADWCKQKIFGRDIGRE
ncbi:NADH:ubiquinone oxidoreductase [Basidiobolus ranarum]|uniref:NADH:ubiquinone reductase (non-electrogenic) n=1 Tax=Basidiobolus ranarum TaxID=34480 RepID=A0ABR2X2W3_9FUNG